MAEESRFKETKDENLTINKELLIQLIDSNTISEELNEKLEYLSDSIDKYNELLAKKNCLLNEHLATKNRLLYITSIILFGILCALFFI